MGKRLGFLLLALLGLVIVAGLSLYAFRQPVLETLINHQLRKHNIPVRSLSVADASLNTLILHELSFGPEAELSADTIFASWKLEDLFAGELATIEISGLQFDLDLSGDSPSLRSLQQLIPATEENTAAQKLPPISLRDSTINLHTPIGDFSLKVDGDIHQDPSGTQSTRLAFEISGPSGRTKGKLSATMEPNGTIQGKVTLSEGSLNLPETEISAFTGDASFKLVDMLPQQISADLILFDVNLPISGLEEKAFEQARLSLQIEGPNARIKGDLLAADNKLTVLFDTTVHDYLREPAIDLDINAHGTAGSYIWKLFDLPQPSNGSVAFSMRANGQTPSFQEARRNRLSWLQHSSLTGQANLALQALGYTRKISGLNGKLALSTEFSNGSGKVILTDDALFDVSSLNPLWLKSFDIPAELGKHFTQGGRLRISGNNDKPAHISLTRHANGAELNVAASANISTTKAQADVKGRLQAILDKRNKLTAFKLSDIEVQTAGISYADTVVDRMRLTGIIQGLPESWIGKLDLEANAQRLHAGPLAAHQANVALPIQVEFDHDIWHINLRKPGTVTLGKLESVDSVRLQGPLSLSLSQVDIRLEQNKGGLTLKHQIAVTPTNFTILAGRDEAPPIEAQIRPGTITIRGEFDTDGKYHGQGVISAAGLTLPQSQIQLDNITSTINLGPAEIDRLADFTVGRLQHTASAPYFAPHSISGSVHVKTVSNKPVLYSVNAIGGIPGAQYLTLNGEHALDSGVGNLKLTIDPLNFSPGGLQPVELFPYLALVKDVSGKVSASTQLKWSKEGISNSNGVLDLQNVSFKQNDTTISDLNATLQLADLLSPKSPPQQKLTIRHINLGVPMENLAVSYQIKATVPPRIAIEEASISLIGGLMSLGPTVIDPNSSSTEMVILVDNLDLGDLFGLIQVEGLTGNGRLAGSIPIILDGKLVAIQHGNLAAKTPGILRFKSEKASQLLSGAGKEMNLLLQALQEFHYSELTLKLDKSAKNDLVATFSLLGSNPNVRNGQLFRLNINLESNIGKILDSIGQGYRLSNETLRNVFSLR